MPSISNSSASPPEGHQAPKEDLTLNTNSGCPSEPDISLHPSDLLRQLAGSMNWRDLPLVILPHAAKWSLVISAVQASIRGKENELLLLHTPVPKSAKDRLRQIALQCPGGPSVQNVPSPIRTKIDLSNFPEPRKPSAALLAILKKNAKTVSVADPYVINIRSGLEDGHLPSIAGRLHLSALDGLEDHPQEMIDWSMCLWDTGSYCSLISEDLLSSTFREFLNHSVHDPYRRSGARNILQVNAWFRFSNHAAEISTIFTVLPVSHIPNSRSGIILGQQAFMAMMVVRCVPRYILIAKGEQVADNEWGDIVVEEYIDCLGELTRA